MMREMDLSRVRQALWEIDRLTTLYWICKEMVSEAAGGDGRHRRPAHPGNPAPCREPESGDPAE